MRLALLLALCLMSCSLLPGHKPKSVDEDERALASMLRDEFDLRLAAVRQLADPATGWPSVTDCDGTLWAGLLCAAGATEVNILEAEHFPGEIHRRPEIGCYPHDLNGDGRPDSRSTISKDMVVGYVRCLWNRKDLEPLQRLADYGEESDWIMGKPESELGRVYIGVSNLPGIIGRAIDRLSEGYDRRPYRQWAPIFPPVKEDFEYHIQTQTILLEGDISGSIRSQALERLGDHVKAMPNDYLAHVALGIYTDNMSEAVDLLLDDPEPPSYVRGDSPEAFALVHWLFAAKKALDHLEK